MKIISSAALAILLSAAAISPRASAQASTDPAIQRKEAELEKERAALQKKQADLDAKQAYLEKAKQDLELQENAKSLSMNLSGDVLFDYDKAILKPEAEAALKKVAVVLSQFPESDVSIEGYTDSKGSKSVNLQLSRDRANVVKDWLVKNGGVAAAHISAQGLGEQNPVAPNTGPDGKDDPAGRAKNRRVSIVVDKPAPTPTSPAPPAP